MKTKIAFIGAGRMATIHAAALEKIEDTEMAGVFDILPEKSRIFAKRFGGKIYSGREEMLSDRSLNGIAICNYGHQHCETALAVMKSGFTRIFCEKPMVRQFGEIPLLLETAGKTGSRICVGHVRRYFREHEKMKEILDSGILGKIRFAKVHCCNAGYSREWGSYFSSYELSGGATLDMGVHYTDLLNWFFGEPSHVYAQAVMLEKTLPGEVKPADYFTGSLVYRNGVICGFDVSYQRYGMKADKVEIYGDNYTLVYDAGTLKMFRKNETVEYSMDRGDPHVEQMRAFVNMIRTGENCRCMLEDGLKCAEIALGMMEAEQKNHIYRF
ncbi:MAG: putative oxidoreductase YcjS [Lentisphaerae bacterium ADurb.Bin242]|nr:MAG: putative oxidoreductase YcjS [Lentisphaerae bacterium ADurb.Bin242]